MTIKVERADGQTEIYENGNYTISKVKDFHPIICKVTIYSSGRIVKSVSRPFPFIYKHFIYKSKKVQTILKNLEEQAKLAEQAKFEEQAKLQANQATKAE